MRRVVMVALVLTGALLGSTTLLAPLSGAAVLPVGKADKVIVVKSERRLYLVRGGEVMESFRVALGRHPKGTKIYQGDGRTPEGVYRVAASTLTVSSTGRSVSPTRTTRTRRVRLPSARRQAATS